MLIYIKGAGDLATGVARRLHSCGFQIVMTETAQPTTVRCTVAFSRAVYQLSLIHILSVVSVKFFRSV